MSVETELTPAGDVVTRERLTRTVALPILPSPAELGSAAAPPTLTVRQRRRQDAQARRDDRRWRRREQRRLHRNNIQASSSPTERCYHSFLQITKILLLPLLILLALLGVILFGVFFCLPLLFFLMGLLCMYYCCTESPVPPRLLWRALVAESNQPVPPAAPVTPPGLTVEEIQQLILKRKCLGVETAAMVKAVDESETVPRDDWGDNVLEQPMSKNAAYWPMPQDNPLGETAFYIFSKPLSVSDVKAAREHDDDVHARPQTPTRDSPAEWDMTGGESKQEESVPKDVKPTDFANDEYWRRPLPVEPSEWTCSACTLLNSSSHSSCSVCLTPRVREPAMPSSDAVAKCENNDDEDDGESDLSETTQVAKDREFAEACRFFGISGETTEEMRAQINKGKHTMDTREIAASAVDTSSSPSHGAVCEICLGDYEAGDIVAWSANPLCKHAFHVECISDWLIRRPTCPSCRQDYIDIPEAMKNAAVENFFHTHRAHPSAAVEMASAFRMGLNSDMSFSSSSGSSASSVQDSINQMILRDDTDVGSEDNV